MRDDRRHATPTMKARVLKATPGRLALRSTLALCAAVALWLAAPGARGPVVVASAEQCPTVRVSCPDWGTAAVPATFAVDISGLAADARPSFNWTVSSGTITSGQGTSAITVDATGAGGQSFTATVEVGGLPAGCANKASCTTNVCTLPAATRLGDSYGDINEEDEMARLDHLAVELQKEPGAQGYLLCYGGRRGRRGEAQARCDRAKDYLVNQRGVEAARLVALDAGYREELTVELWVLPTGAHPPVFAPTVEPADVEFVEPAPRRRPARRRPAAPRPKPGGGAKAPPPRR